MVHLSAEDKHSPDHFYSISTTQIDDQPSPIEKFPSSHHSDSVLRLSPHSVTHSVFEILG